MKLDFSRGAWNTDEMTYAYTYRFPGTPEFLQQDDCVENRPDATNRFGCDWENISMLSRVRKPLRPPTRRGIAIQINNVLILVFMEHSVFCLYIYMLL